MIFSPIDFHHVKASLINNLMLEMDEITVCKKRKDHFLVTNLEGIIT